VLLALPWAALNGFEIRRNAVNETEVQADLIFTLYFDGRPESGGTKP